MSIAIGHFAFGAAMTTLVVTFLVPTDRYPRTIVLFGGGWAMLPDFHWISPIAAERLRELHQTSALTDIFWLHRTWDRLDPTDSKPIAAGLLAVLFVATAIAERREYRVPRSVETTYREYLDLESDD
ncbi:hypothetical protein C488_01294 [Natrinema pellirubrum DSM 15624]|uniref:Uncharacterized protein n=1 Tax=Natrinema pellirubrum (strain DSM 15624 / CIP 106293 / JCM 10476 / NCIMB 786 / 157) TaxID=797303 RepID=L0JI85_NATP1|nr:hypothetical protein [Natrinema pellirubrum]AGB31235.1 hypothetical protein Natpe_1330 [Natrinema pellirubrum DSM 15624]ELY81830.1 hypothetical protein C488_01294 [Natrinema pellirubrum DSM 15624]